MLKPKYDISQLGDQRRWSNSSQLNVLRESQESISGSIREKSQLKSDEKLKERETSKVRATEVVIKKNGVFIDQQSKQNTITTESKDTRMHRSLGHNLQMFNPDTSKNQQLNEKNSTIDSIFNLQLPPNSNMNSKPMTKRMNNQK